MICVLCAFIGAEQSAPTNRDEKFVFEMVRNIHVVFRKGVKEKMKEGKMLIMVYDNDLE
jgi:hypothetical protein